MARLLLILCVWIGSPIEAQQLPVAGEGAHLWAAIASDDEATFTLWHRVTRDTPDVMREVEKLTGRLAEIATVGIDGTLWLIYRDGSVQSISANQSSMDRQWRYSDRQHRRLPTGARLRSLAVGPRGPWVLIASEFPPPEVPPEVFSEAPQISQTLTGLGVGDRLLELTAKGWQSVVLPDDWPVEQVRSAVVMLAQVNDRPALLVQVAEVDLSVYLWQNETWQRTDYTLADPSRWLVASVDRQLVLAQRLDEAEGVAVSLSVLRKGRTTVLGELRVPGQGPMQWSMVGIGDTVAVLAHEQGGSEKSPELAWTAMDLLGQEVHPVATLGADQGQLQSQRIEGAMFIAVMVLTLFMLFVFWRRDPRLNRPTLGPGLRVSELSRRALGGVIDLAGPIVVVMVNYDVTFTQLVSRWPGNQTNPAVIEPGATVIALFMIHVLISELIFARTLGKAILGLHVCRLDGTRPRFWQLLVRNLLKIFDLIAWLLLLFPLLSPFRQRLGDLVAQTLVVVRQGSGEPGEPGEAGEDSDEAESGEKKDD